VYTILILLGVPDDVVMSLIETNFPIRDNKGYFIYCGLKKEVLFP